MNGDKTAQVKERERKKKEKRGQNMRDLEKPTVEEKLDVRGGKQSGGERRLGSGETEEGRGKLRKR